MIHKVIRSGKHSLGVIIPANFIHALGIKPGDSVRIEATPDKGKVSVFFTGALQLKLPETLASKK